MSHPSGEEDIQQDPDNQEDLDNGEDRQVPEGVLRGIDDLAHGNTASKEDIESVLKY